MGLVLVAGYLWSTATGLLRGPAGQRQAEISFQEFRTRLLAQDKVARLEIANNSLVKVCARGLGAQQAGAAPTQNAICTQERWRTYQDPATLQRATCWPCMVLSTACTGAGDGGCARYRRPAAEWTARTTMAGTASMPLPWSSLGSILPSDVDDTEMPSSAPIAGTTAQHHARLARCGVHALQDNVHVSMLHVSTCTPQHVHGPQLVCATTLCVDENGMVLTYACGCRAFFCRPCSPDACTALVRGTYVAFSTCL